MLALYLTPASLGYLTQFIIALMITGYFIFRLASPRARSARPTHLRLLTGFFACITLLASLFFLEVSLLPTERLYAVYLQNATLGAGIVLLLQFAYRFPSELPRKWEAHLALGLSVLYALYEAAFAAYRYCLISAQGQVIFRPEWADYPMALGLLWAPIMFVRQSVRASKQDLTGNLSGLDHLWRPQGRAASTARALALVYLLPFGLSLLTILKTFYFIPADLYQLSLSVGIMITLAAFAVIYLNHLPETTSFVVKLVGVTLVALLAVLGAVGWALTPIYTKLYRPAWPDHQTLRFVPNAGGGYDVALVPFQFESDLGANLDLVDVPDKANQQASAKLDFDFSFYGKTYSQVHATNDGTISMGQVAIPYNYQYHYGGRTPLIFPMLTDLIPEAGPGGVFARQETDRLILTWDRVPSFYRREAVFTFQVVLRHSGVFEITYNGLPERQEYHANDDPMANVWLIGSLPGDLAAAPQRLDVSQLGQGRIVTSGPQGIVQDYYLDLRRHLHTLLLPLAYLMGGASVLVVFGFPLLFYLNLVNPLNALIAGVRRMNQGQFDATITPQYQDEIGFLAQSFNAMGAALKDLIATLEKRVAARTAELEQAKTRGEFANAQLAANVRELAARNQELDAFAHTVAHDIRGPVGQIVGYAELLDEDFDELSAAERHQALDTLAAAGYKLTNIIDELLLLAGLRNVEVQPEPLDMGAIVREAQARLTDVIQRSGTLISQPDDAAWPVALGHPAWIEEVWVNYLSNACKYGGLDDAPPRIIIGADYPLPNSPPSGTEESEGGGAIRFWVRDAGRGIAPQDQARLFTPFTRLDQVRVQGHGLGLSIVRRIVEKLGGQVGVESDGVPGHGSTFYFTLPAAPAGAPRPVAPAKSVEPGSSGLPDLDRAALRGVRVLIVDDEKLFADSLRCLLTAQGLVVEGVAHDGQAAQELARALKPQIVLMDIDMPRVNGLVAARAIKVEQPEAKIVMLTASEHEADVFEAIRSGASGYLLKGVSAEALHARLAGLMRGEAPLSPRLAERILAEFARLSRDAEPGEALTPRQTEILQRVAQGQTYKEIGAALFLTEQTIKYHMGQIIDRLHVKNRTQAVAYFEHTLKPRPRGARQD